MAAPELQVSPQAQMAETREPSREWRTFWRNPLAWAGVFGLVFIVLFSFVGPLVYHANDLAIHLNDALQPPSAQFPLGTDELGRNNLSRMMIGGQLSLEVGFAAALVSMVIGVVYGMISGYIGGFTDVLLMRIVDVLYSIPSLFFLLFIDSVFRPSAILLIFIIAVFSWFGVARLVRGQVLSLKSRDYVEAARALGAGNGRIMWRHLLPNVTGVVLVSTTLQVANAILTVAGLSFLGLGLPPPTPNWGQMLSDSMNYMFQNAWWLIYPPGFAILLVELCTNFIGVSLNQAYDPRLRK
ncbi:MAG: peptide ABC transporter permease [Sulfobacillus acidophilus]|uniref:Peptide ABC transporter permease n=1 Tax=Sulfobacillus acidophilus TaxID=53633 RepID=A0A2T2WM89_9FIRM|nr:MAG: peptide ABC transporter permease [Sulfobacillus acidophilus]